MSRIEEILLLGAIPRVGPAQVHAALEACPEPDELHRLPREELVRRGLTKRLASEIVRLRGSGEATREMERCAKMGIRLVSTSDPDYPGALLCGVHAPPPLLYVRGSLGGADAEDRCAIAMVGARRCSPYGRHHAARIATELSDRGVPVISGLARGIDTAAHRGALEGQGGTLAVLGSALNRVYPAENRGLAERIIDEGGAVLSEFALDTPPLRSNFPRRNRLLSGLSKGVIVVEATRKSGSLITVDWALDQGRDVFAVPGPIDSELSRGVHKLLRHGARLVENAADVLEEMEGVKPLNDPDRNPARSPGTPTAVLGPRESQIASLLGRAPVYFDQLVERSGLPVSVVSALLTLLELKGVSSQMPGKWFVLKSAYRVPPEAKEREEPA